LALEEEKKGIRSKFPTQGKGGKKRRKVCPQILRGPMARKGDFTPRAIFKCGKRRKKFFCPQRGGEKRKKKKIKRLLSRKKQYWSLSFRSDQYRRGKRGKRNRAPCLVCIERGKKKKGGGKSAKSFHFALKTLSSPREEEKDAPWYQRGEGKKGTSIFELNNESRRKTAQSADLSQRGRKKKRVKCHSHYFLKEEGKKEERKKMALNTVDDIRKVASNPNPFDDKEKEKKREEPSMLFCSPMPLEGGEKRTTHG